MKIITGNLLEQTSGIIVHGVNCQGVMGGGIALQIRRRYPQVYEDYIHRIRSVLSLSTTNAERETKRKSLLGQVVYTQISPELIIASAFTQMGYGNNPDIVYANYAAIKQAFKTIADDLNIEISLGGTDRVIKFPMIGAGLARGDWNIIQSSIFDVEFEYPDTEFQLFVL